MFGQLPPGSLTCDVKTLKDNTVDGAIAEEKRNDPDNRYVLTASALVPSTPARLNSLAVNVQPRLKTPHKSSLE